MKDRTEWTPPEGWQERAREIAIQVNDIAYDLSGLRNELWRAVSDDDFEAYIAALERFGREADD